MLFVQPSISFEQQLAGQGITSLQCGQQVLPSLADTKPNSRRSPQGKAAMADELLQTRSTPTWLLLLVASMHQVLCCLGSHLLQRSQRQPGLILAQLQVL